MTKTALLDLPIEHTKNALAEASTRARSFVDQVQAALDSALEIPLKAREKWNDLQLFAQRGNAERAGVMRGVFFYRLAQYLEILRQVQLQAEQAGVVAGEPLQRIDQLAAGMDDLGNLRREVHAGWPGTQPLPDAAPGAFAAPLRIDIHGDIFVGDSGVLLDTIVEEFEAGTPPEEIVSGYDTIQRADVYGAIAYYLKHKRDVEAYLQQRNREGEQLWKDIEAAQPSNADLKARIKERWSRRKVANGSPAE